MGERRKIDFATALNEEQFAAATHGEGPQLVIAGAGSGKTRVITYRIAWLVLERGVDPAAIAAVTFTNKAAAEMKERVENLLGLYPLPTSLSTFHRFALRFLRRYGARLDLPQGFAILDASDQRSLVKKAMASEGITERSFRPQSILAAISGAKNRLLDPSRYQRQAEDSFTQTVARVYRRYQALVRQAGAVDFDDMIAHTVKLLHREEHLCARLRQRYRYLLVDEFQDTNHAQLQLIHALTGEGGNLTAVGDEDQGIYRWRGAELENILRFERSFPGAAVRKLERNYRSTQTILDASGAVVAHNAGRRDKRLWTADGGGAPLRLYRARDEQDEARWIVRTLRDLELDPDADMTLADMGILVRTNAQTRALEEELLRQRLPYNLVGGTRFYERAEIKDLVAFLRVLRNPHDSFSLSRILNRPPRGIGKATQSLLLERAEAENRSAWDVLTSDDLASLPRRSTHALARFRDLITTLLDDAEVLPLPALLRALLDTTRYVDLYRQDDAEGQSKRENIEEFLAAAQEFTESVAYGSQEEDTLGAFLDHAALAGDIDTWHGGSISLMTLHSAKGLEFSAVAVAGLESGLLPHFNARSKEEDVEEERRLLYVGMTRARKRLLLTCSSRRRVGATYEDRKDSPFLAEIPAELVQEEVSPELRATHTARRHRQADSVYAFFGRTTTTAAPPDEVPVIEQESSPPSKDHTLKKGSRVRHPSLGRGVVLAMEGSGLDLRLSIYFDGVGRRKLVARYAELEVI